MDSSQCSELLDKFGDSYNDLVTFGKMHGVEALNGLLCMMGGQKAHIPMVENFWAGLKRTVRDEEIRAKFNGKNYHQLGMDYELDERQVRRIVHGERRRYTPSADAPKVMKVSSSNYRAVTDIASRYGLSHIEALNVLLEIVTGMRNIDALVREAVGQQVELEVVS